MGTGAKIAIGCGIAVLVTGAAVVVGVVGLGFWAKSKVDTMQAGFQELEELQKKADAIPFTAPEDGVIQEPRLVKFLEARKKVFPIYDKYQTEIQGLQNLDKKKDADFSDIGKAMGAVAGLHELQKEHLRALVDVGMSREEYRYLVQAVYQSWWAVEVEKSTGKTLQQNTDAAKESMKEAARQLDQQSQQPIDPNLPPEAQKAMREAQDRMRDSKHQLEHSAEQVDTQTAGLDIPPANLVLFRKYEEEIRKYAMTGLEFLNL